MPENNQEFQVDHLDIDLLQTFVAIADTGNFSKAARKIDRTASAVSMQIKKLEDQLATSLFIRSSKSVTLTCSGETLLFQARRLIAMSKEVVTLIRNPELKGLVTLGVPGDIAERMLPRVLKELEAVYPSIAVNVVVNNSQRLIERASKGELDLAIVNFASASSSKPGELLATEETIWVGAKGGHAYQREPLPLAVYDSACIWRDAAVKQLVKSNRSYRIAYANNHNILNKSVLTADLAVAPIPASYITDDMVALGAAEGFSKLPSFDIRLISVKKLTPPMEIVVGLVREMFSRYPRTPGT